MGTKGRKAAQTKGPGQVAWGGEGEAAPGTPQAERQPRDRCGREEEEEASARPAPPWPEATAATAISLPRTSTPRTWP